MFQGRTGEAEEHQDDAEVHDVAAVAAPILLDESEQGATSTVSVSPRFCAVARRAPRRRARTLVRSRPR